MKLCAIATLWAATWLMPFAGGPSPSVMPWLSCLCLLSALLMLAPWQRPAWPVSLLYAALSIGAVVSGDWSDRAVVLTPCLLGAGWLAAGMGAAASSRPMLLRALAWAWLGAALLSAVIGLCQFFRVEHLFGPLMNQSVQEQIFANLRQRNQFASLTSIGLVALLYLSGQGLARVQTVWMLVLLALGNAASTSHTGSVQWLTLAFMVFCWRRHVSVQTRWLAWAAWPGYALAVGLLHLLGEGRFSALSRLAVDERSCAGRRYLWRNVVELITQRPWTGWGWHDLAWAHFVTPFEERFCDIPDNAHSLPLQLAVELGLPAALLFCAGLAWLIWRAHPWREADPRRQLAWGVFTVILLHSLVEYPLWYGPFMLAFGLAMGLLWPAARPAGPATPPPWQSLAGLALLVLVIACILDYQRVSQVYLAPEQRAAAYKEDPLGKTRDSWLFAGQVQFAELAITPVTPDNAPALYALARQVLHYSPEPRVVEKLIEAARLSGHDADAAFHERQYRAAFPEDHARWAGAALR